MTDDIEDSEFAERCRSAVTSQFEFTSEQIDSIIEHARLVRVANRTLNLTRIVDPESMAALHIADSLAAMPLFDDSIEHVLDVGTGAGFPGIPLSVVVPDCRYTLIDGTRKKADFVTSVIKALRLSPRVESRWARLEEPGLLEATRPDALALRAVGPIDRVLGWLPRGFQGQLWFWKGPSVDEELADARPAMDRAQLRLADRLSYSLPEPESNRSHEIVVLSPR